MATVNLYEDGAGQLFVELADGTIYSHLEMAPSGERFDLDAWLLTNAPADWEGGPDPDADISYADLVADWSDGRVSVYRRPGSAAATYLTGFGRGYSAGDLTLDEIASLAMRS